MTNHIEMETQPSHPLTWLKESKAALLPLSEIRDKNTKHCPWVPVTLSLSFLFYQFLCNAYIPLHIGWLGGSGIIMRIRGMLGKEDNLGARFLASSEYRCTYLQL